MIIALQIPLFWLAFQVSPATEAVESQARLYMQIRVLSAPAAIALYGLNGWLIAQERTRSVLLLQLWMNGLISVLNRYNECNITNFKELTSVIEKIGEENGVIGPECLIDTW